MGRFHLGAGSQLTLNSEQKHTVQCAHHTHTRPCPSPANACLQYYSFAGPMNGTLTAKACGIGGFPATVTVFAEAAVEGGKPTPLGCGTCAKPAV